MNEVSLIPVIAEQLKYAMSEFWGLHPYEPVAFKLTWSGDDKKVVNVEMEWLKQ